MKQPPTVIASSDQTSRGSGRFVSVVLGLALVSCIGLMLPFVFGGPVVLDEYGTYWIAGDGPLSLWERSLNYENIPPLAPAVNRLFFQVYGESEFVFRLPSALCYVISVVLIWRLGREIRDAEFGALLALVLAWHPVLLDEVRIARCYGLTLLLSIVVLHSTLMWLRSTESIRLPILWAISCSLLLWTHYLNAILVVATALLLAWYLFKDSFRGKYCLLGAWIFVAGTALPLWPSLVRMSVWGEYFGFQTESRLTETVSSLWWAGLPTAFLLSFLFARGNRVDPVSRTRQKRVRVVLFVCGVLPILGAAIFCRGDFASLANPRYRTCIEASGVCVWVLLATRGRSSVHSLAIVCAGLVAAWGCSGHVPWQPRRVNTVQSFQWKEVALYIQANGTAGQPIFVQSGLGEAALLREFFDDSVLQDYAACRLGRFYLKAEHPRIGLPFVWNLNAKMNQWYRDRLSEIAESPAGSFWLAVATDTDVNQSSGQYFEDMAKSAGFTALETLQFSKTKLIQFRFGNQKL
ncbi:MAG: glycosyltransferase family 39 protein [Planctomycetaceae bacterium]